MSGEPFILRENRGPLRLLTLNRPQVRNAMSVPLMHDLLAALNEARTDSTVRAVVLTGAGSAFCAGLDLDELRGLGERTREQHRADSGVFRSLLETLYLFPKPVVAAVQGHAVTGGRGWPPSATSRWWPTPRRWGSRKRASASSRHW